jgi:hypothetical protein
MQYIISSAINSLKARLQMIMITITGRKKFRLLIYIIIYNIYDLRVLSIYNYPSHHNVWYNIHGIYGINTAYSTRPK